MIVTTLKNLPTLPELHEGGSSLTLQYDIYYTHFFESPKYIVDHQKFQRKILIVHSQ